MSGIIGGALPLLAPQSFAQGTLERRVASTKQTDFLQTVIDVLMCAAAKYSTCFAGIGRRMFSI